MKSSGVSRFFNAMIHKFINNGIYLVYDVESGTLLELDECAYDLLGEEGLNNPKELKEKYSKEELTETLAELESLVEEGYLYTQPAKLEAVPIENHQVKALCLHIAHDCNLRCKYCFAGQGDFAGERSLMSLETGKKAIDFVIKSSGTRHNIEIDFFGGEPMLNFEVVKGIVEYAQSQEEACNKHFKFTMTTNGVLLDKDNMTWLDENMDNIVLSHDGRKEVNDKMRETISGHGSYDLITPKILEMVRRRNPNKDYYVRGTYTKENLDFSEDVKHFVDLGIGNISIEPVVTEETVPYHLGEEDLEVIRSEYEKLAKYCLDNDVFFFHFNIDLEGGPCLYKRISGCGAGTDYLAITPDGEIYPCHQFASKPEFKIGTLDTGIQRPEIMNRFSEAGLLNKEACQNCWCRYICGGGCHANSFEFSGDLKIPYNFACECERARVESAMMIESQK